MRRLVQGTRTGHTGREGHYMFTTDSTHASITQARQQVVEHLVATGVDADLEAVQLVVSELVTNAVRHTPSGSWSLSITADSDGLSIEISDTGAALPQKRTGDWRDGHGGLGLPLVESLCHRMQTTVTDTGKTITVHWKIG